MKTQVVPATRPDHDVIRNLMELYAYDFSDILGLEVEESGRFADRPLEAYWQDPWRFPFLIRRGAYLAGFALVHRKSKLSGADDVWDMAEFFVLRKHRRVGVGREAAHQIFAAHLGAWEVRERKENERAIAFWRNAIAAYTAGAFSEDMFDDTRWRGAVQRFTSAAR